MVKIITLNEFRWWAFAVLLSLAGCASMPQTGGSTSGLPGSMPGGSTGGSSGGSTGSGTTVTLP
ncbi:MAG: hypothetical protein EB048_01905, partial [Gammaproteobacteria bacterium]|nr:hypothetical protein [Gammaproteobacteria bacterium]